MLRAWYSAELIEMAPETEQQMPDGYESGFEVIPETGENVTESQTQARPELQTKDQEITWVTD